MNDGPVRSVAGDGGKTNAQRTGLGFPQIVQILGCLALSDGTVLDRLFYPFDEPDHDGSVLDMGLVDIGPLDGILRPLHLDHQITHQHLDPVLGNAFQQQFVD